MRFFLWFSIAAVCFLGGSATADAHDPVSSDAAWPLRFFSGRTVGSGELRLLLSRAKPFEVQSLGRIHRNGTLALRQRIRIAGEKPSTREWRLRRAAGNRYVGTLTDAVGPVIGEVSRNRLVLRYTMKGALRPRIRQTLTLQSDGHTIANELQATKLGLPIAAVRETIRKMR